MTRRSQSWLMLTMVVLVAIALSQSGRGVRAQTADLIDRAAFLTPTMDVRPAIRWWWPGGDVDDQELARELTVMRDAGFGSVEIQSFAVGLPSSAAAAVRTYGTPEWFDHVVAAVEHAQTLGLTVDLTLGSSWPSGGAQIQDGQSLQQLTSTGLLVTGPGSLDAEFPTPSEPVAYGLAATLLKLPNTFVPAKMTPSAILAVRLADDQTQEYAPATPTVPGMPTLAPTTYLDSTSVVDLSPYVTGGRVQWPVPSGSWVVFVLFRGPTGTQTFYGAEPSTGLVLDHLSQSAATVHLQGVAQAASDRLGSRFGTTLRSLFVDSPELRTELYWTSDLLSEFATRRGYRLEPFLPILFRPFNGDAYLRSIYPNAPPSFEMRNVGPRVRYDYDQTVSDLMVERFFGTIGTWATTHGIGARMQAHGAPVDLLKGYAQARVPETEGLYAGGQPSFLKIAASAAHNRGVPLVSSEVMAFRGANATPGMMLREANKQFAAGVNQLVLHGFPYMYTKSGFQLPGWMPFNSPHLPGHEVIGTFGTHLNDTSPFWRFMPDINAQLSRAQLALRMGRPVANVALYWDRIGYPDDPTLSPEVNRQLERSGQNYDYVNADMLAGASITGNALQMGGNVYRALVVADAGKMPLQVAGRIAGLVDAGVPVVFVRDVPYQIPGYFQAAQNDVLVKAFFERMFGQNRDTLIAQPKVRSGSALFISSPADLGTALAGDLQIAPDLILSDDRDHIHFAHRQTAVADYYFLTSSHTAPFDTLVSFPNGAAHIPQVFDLRTGLVRQAAAYSVQGDRTVVPVHLDPGGSVLIGFEPASGPAASHVEATDIPFVTRDDDGTLLATVLSPGIYRVTRDNQTVEVRIGDTPLDGIGLPVWDLVTLQKDANGSVVRRSFPGITLGDLSAVPQLAGFVGTAIYAITVNVDPAYRAPGVHLMLNLGQVHDIAEVRVNDRAVKTLTTKPFQVDVTSYLTSGVNRIEVGVTVGGAPAGLIGSAYLVPVYQVTLDGLAPALVPPLPFTVVVTPANFPSSTLEDMLGAISKAATITNHVNFQWFWKTPPSSGFPDGGAIVECEQVTPWVTEAKRLGLGVTLQFQTFVTQLTAPDQPPHVRITNPLIPLDEASFANAELRAAYLEEIACLAGLEPDYLVLGPEMNFVVSYDYPEFQRYQGVYRKAYDTVKAISPWTQVGLSWQYDGLRMSLPLDTWGYIPAAGPQDFIGLTTYYGFSDERFLEYPTASDIPADYYHPIRARFGPDMPILFTEVGYSSLYPNGLANQAEFLQRLPALLADVRPVSVAWALLHDVDYFVGPSASLNQSGMLHPDGTSKPVWDRALELKANGTLIPVTPRVQNPAPMPFAVMATPPNLPAAFDRPAGLAAIATAAQVSGHVGLQFAWKDWVTKRVADCRWIRPYTDEAKRLGLTFTIQFNTYHPVAPPEQGSPPRIVFLNPINPATDTVQDADHEPSIRVAAIRDAYVRQVACLAGLKPDYLVLGPEVNFLAGYRPDEFEYFISAYQEAYAAAKAASPSTQVSVSYQYDAIRGGLMNQELPSFIPRIGPQDYLGVTTYFAMSAPSRALYPSVVDVPHDYYDPIRALVGPDIPVVFTEVGWTSYFPHGNEDQVLFLNRLPTLLGAARPANVLWALQHDVLDYYTNGYEALNFVGLRRNDGAPKLAWGHVRRLRDTGIYVTARPVL